jgi:hypothetical protein
MAAGRFPNPPKVKKNPRRPLGRVFDASARARRRQDRRAMLDRPVTQGPVDGREAMQEARQAAGLKYGSADRMLGREIKGSVGQHRQIDRAYNLYGQKLGAIAAQTMGAYQNFQNAAYQQANQDTAQVQQGAVPGSELSQQTQNAAAVRNANTVNFGGMIGAQGASQTAYQNDQRRIGELERLGAHGKEKSYRRELKGQRRDIRKEKGQYRSEVLRQIRDDERKWTLEQVAFEIDKYQAAQDAANDRRDDKRAKAEEKRDRKEARRDAKMQNLPSGFRSWKAYNAYKAKHEGHGHTVVGGTHDEPNKSSGSGGSDSDGPSPATPTERRNNREEWRKAVQLVRSKPPATPDDVKAAISALVGRGHDPLMARAAVQRVFRGYVKPSLARRIRREYPGVKPSTKRKGRSPAAGNVVGGVNDIVNSLPGSG